jgi:cysteinyl-tRNA synthetase
MFRLYDARLREVAEIRPARRGLLRVRALPSASGQPSHLGDLRTWLLCDLIRRNAERHGWSVIVGQDEGGAGGPAATDLAALSIAPPDLEYQAPSGPGAGEVIDIGVGEEDAASRSDNGRHLMLVAPVLFDGQDMSAASRNVAAPTVGLADVTARGLDPLAVRRAFLEHRYSEPLDLTWDQLVAADSEVRRWRELVARWANEPSKPISADYRARFTGALDDDLDTPAALAVLGELAADSEIPAGSRFESFAAADRVLGLDLVSLVGQLPA